jgi:hypothetical protein
VVNKLEGRAENLYDFNIVRSRKCFPPRAAILRSIELRLQCTKRSPLD